MAIMMQGSWTVAFKSKSASYDQRYIISGADDLANGTYEEPFQGPIFVTGDQWSIAIESNPGTGWVSSKTRIKFPVAAGGLYRFDIESNDPGGDEDFNDLILTCSMPQTASDFLIYGNVSCYSGRCVLNPCRRRWLVIETLEHLHQAMVIPALREAIEEVYPDRLALESKPGIAGPFPKPDPPPFTPLVLPLAGDTALPPRLAQVLKVTEVAATPKGGRKAKAAADVELANVQHVGSFEIGNVARRDYQYGRAELGTYFDRLRLFCDTDALPGYVLRFLEYDRNAAELAGGAYTGDGDREELGLTATDVNGNYIFRFSRDFADAAQEITEDWEVSEDATVQALPDVIVQLLDSSLADGVGHETAPSWNVPLKKRIDLCFPCSKITQPSSFCGGDPGFERIGRIRIGIPETVFDGEGRVTCTDTSSSGIPQARCAAWHHSLVFFACVGNYQDVPYYTVRHRHQLSGGGWSDWEFYQESLGIFNVALGKNQNIGATDRLLEVDNGQPLEQAKAYDNVLENYDWATSEWAMKAVVTSGGGSPPYAPQPGPVQFRIQGYNAAGQQVTDTEDTVTLYIDNTRPDYGIASVDMGTQTGGKCALFSLTGEPDPAPLRVRFKAIDEQGFLNRYQLSVRKGNIYPDKAIVTTAGPLGEVSGSLSNSYADPSANPCGQLVGTRVPEEPQADASDIVTVWVVPDTGNWLDEGQTFCTFAVKLRCSKRVTNGYNDATDGYGPQYYLLGIEA